MTTAPASLTLNTEPLDEIPVNRDYLADEGSVIRQLLPMAAADTHKQQAVRDLARRLVQRVRSERQESGGLHALLNHYDLSSHEGILLMCLAEALLRIPDSDTVDKLIADKITSANWARHLGESESLFVNASTWALMLSGRVMNLSTATVNNPAEYLARLAARLEEPVIRSVIKAAMHLMAYEFVMGNSIDDAIERSLEKNNRVYRYSFDMLGEAALTAADADRYQAAYLDAIETIGGSVEKNMPFDDRPGISVKLSALSPRFEYNQFDRAQQELAGRLLVLAAAARQQNIALTVDAEEADRLQLLLSVFEKVYANPALTGWNGLGVAVQAYQKRALGVLVRLNGLAGIHGRVIPVRLVKGAYWDTEIKRAQQAGLSGFPVFTRKSNTDVSYLACARYLLKSCKGLYPQFATHNAHTLSWIYHHAGERGYEFQRLHGMGEELYGEVVGADRLARPCRVYAPVGEHKDLLPYLVRRLLENGANTSFVNQIVHADIDMEAVIADPVGITEKLEDQISHPRIALPRDLFAPARKNSTGVNFADDIEYKTLVTAMEPALETQWHAEPVINGRERHGLAVTVHNPAAITEQVGVVGYADEVAIRLAIDTAATAWQKWNSQKVDDRAGILERTADLFEEQRASFIALCIREAGKTLRDAHDDVREAVDFLRYYALCARQQLSEPQLLPGPTGEHNELGYQGRGVFACISPWNFPVAICTGQVAAALVSGNTVIMKPAEQTSLVAGLVGKLFYQAGVPADVLSVLPCTGELFGRMALQDERIAGVAFTGSTGTARLINRTLAEREAALATLIAETGGQNAMLADSSALPEQVVKDVVHSAFNSAGQRCSALRVLYLQEDIAPRVLELLTGHLDELVIGDPLQLETDIGPVIDAEAVKELETHVLEMEQEDRLLYRGKVPSHLDTGFYVAPVVIRLDSINQLQNEHFGPILHVITWPAEALDHVIDEINNCGYGLTLGIQSRIESQAEYIRSRVQVGNVYVNRDMVGAVVGVQPFGGCRLSGTGPKAGGPNYLLRFVTEQTTTINTAAVGGNASLLALTP